MFNYASAGETACLYDLLFPRYGHFVTGCQIFTFETVKISIWERTQVKMIPRSRSVNKCKSFCWGRGEEGSCNKKYTKCRAITQADPILSVSRPKGRCTSHSRHCQAARLFRMVHKPVLDCSRDRVPEG
jgi:hypothetical protein